MLLYLNLVMLPFLNHPSLPVNTPSSGQEDQIRQLEETASRLRQENERSEVVHREELSRKESSYMSEIKQLKDKVRESESQQVALNREIMISKDKVEKARREKYVVLTHCTWTIFFIRRFESGYLSSFYL